MSHTTKQERMSSLSEILVPFLPLRDPDGSRLDSDLVWGWVLTRVYLSLPLLILFYIIMCKCMLKLYIKCAICVHVYMYMHIYLYMWQSSHCRGHGDAVLCLHFHGNKLVSGSKDTTIKVYLYMYIATRTGVLCCCQMCTYLHVCRGKM